MTQTFVPTSEVDKKQAFKDLFGCDPSKISEDTEFYISQGGFCYSIIDTLKECGIKSGRITKFANGSISITDM